MQCTDIAVTYVDFNPESEKVIHPYNVSNLPLVFSSLLSLPAMVSATTNLPVLSDYMSAEVKCRSMACETIIFPIFIVGGYVKYYWGTIIGT